MSNFRFMTLCIHVLAKSNFRLSIVFFIVKANLSIVFDYSRCMRDSEEPVLIAIVVIKSTFGS